MIVVLFCRVTISPVGSSLVICQGVLWLWQEVRLVLPLSAPVSSCHRRQQWKLKLFSSINSLVASLGLCPTLSLTSHNRDSPLNLLLSSLWQGGSSAANPLKINNINKISFLALVIPFQYKDTARWDCSILDISREGDEGWIIMDIYRIHFYQYLV